MHVGFKLLAAIAVISLAAAGCGGKAKPLDGEPLGAFCGATDTCNSSLPEGRGADQWPGCQAAQCASRICLGTAGGAQFLLPTVCSSECRIYKDTNNDGVNDEDAERDDCNPREIVDGPAGDTFRCVNLAEAGAAPRNRCVPGTAFNTCSSDADCPSDEACTISTLLAGESLFGTRCVAKYRENSSWTATIAGLSESCNDEPVWGPLSYCESGLCMGGGCSPLCVDDSECDTTTVYAGTGCISNKCGGTGKACTTDGECSAWSCSEPRDIFGGEGRYPLFKTCSPRTCDVSNDCGAGFYCHFAWNGEVGQAAALENICLAENPEGVNLGEACDPNPDDNIPGATCKAEDLCVGGYCSALCRTDSDCNTAAGQVCGIEEIAFDASDPADDINDVVIAFGLCRTFPNHTGSCRTSLDCATDFECALYVVTNPDPSRAADGPYLVNGTCVPVDTAKFPGTTGDYGTSCRGDTECKSGHCLGASPVSPGLCAQLCAASSDCPDITLDGDLYRGLCNSSVYGLGGDLDDARVNYSLNLCVPTQDSVTDCSASFTCATGEACFPNVISWDPATKSEIEYNCATVVSEGEPAPTKTVGQRCDPNADTVECVSGMCHAVDGSATDGFCSALCDDNNPCGNGTTCYDVTRAPRRGVYAANSATYGVCLQDPICDPCSSHDDCPGDYICVKAGAANSAKDDDGFRCVPSCEVNVCAGGVTCNAGSDQLGDTLQGCFEQTGNVPALSCPAVP